MLFDARDTCEACLYRHALHEMARPLRPKAVQRIRVSEWGFRTWAEEFWSLIVIPGRRMTSQRIFMYKGDLTRSLLTGNWYDRVRLELCSRVL